MNAADDALILKLQKEVQYLKEILNLNRRGGNDNVNQQLLLLKDENARLKQFTQRTIDPNMRDVRELSDENKQLKSEIMKLKERLGENDQSQIRMFDETPEDKEGDTTNSMNMNAKPEVFHSRKRNIKIEVKSPKFEDSASSSYSVEQTKG